MARGTARRALVVAARFGLAAAYASLFLHTTGGLWLKQLLVVVLCCPAMLHYMLAELCPTLPTSRPPPLAPELFPAVVREPALGAANAFGRAGAALTPLFAFLQAKLHSPFVPLLVLGCLAVAAAVLSVGLPETLGEPCPQTIQELHSLLAIKRKRSWRLALAGVLRPSASAASLPRSQSSQAEVAAAARSV